MTRLPRRAILAGLALAIAVLAGAGIWQASRSPAATSPHQRAVAVEQTLRCPTCQGLSIADSPSPIAAGMRQQVEQQIAAGKTTEEIRVFFVNRYSDWILLSPPRRGIGWLVWLAPALALLAGLWLVRRTLRRRSTPAQDVDDAQAELSAAECAAAAAFADNPPDGPMPEPVAAALADLRATRLDAELDQPADAGVDDALARLAAALRDHPLPAPQAEPGPQPEPDPQPEAEPDTTGPTGRRRQVPRYVLAAAAVVFAGLLALTLARAVGNRPAGAVITGNFATAAPGSPGSGSAPQPTDQLAVLQRDTRTRPDDPVAWLAYATALDQAGQLADAEPAYRKTLALDPGNTAATEQYAWLLTRGGASTEALPLLTPLARQRPDDPHVVLLLGLAQYGAHDPQAPTTLRHYLALAPDTPQAAVVRGLLGPTP